VPFFQTMQKNDSPTGKVPLRKDHGGGTVMTRESNWGQELRKKQGCAASKGKEGKEDTECLKKTELKSRKKEK